MVLLLLVLAGIAFWPDPTLAAYTSDAPDYVLPSLNFLKGKGMVIMVDGVKQPPQHPFGLPLMMSVAYIFLGPYPGNGVYVVFLLGLGSVVLIYYLGRRIFDFRVGFLAALFVIASDLFRWNAKIIYSDVPSAFLFLAAHALLLSVLANRQSSRWKWFALGQIVGLAVAVRWDNAALVLPVGVLAFCERKNQDRWVSKVLLTASGVLVWQLALLYTNYLYTGDFFRSPAGVTESINFDRPGGLVSWRHFSKSPLGQKNLVRLLRGGLYQWSQSQMDPDKVKGYLYVSAWILSLAGGLKLAGSARRERSIRQLLIWVGLLLLFALIFYSCVFGPVWRRYMLRTVVYLCLINAVGTIALWDSARRLRYAGMVAARVAVAGFVAAFAVYMLSHHFVEQPFAGFPVIAYLEQAKKMIQDDDAVIVSNFNILYVEYYLVQDSHRTFLPLHQYLDTVWWQWKKPPHPEWIEEDSPTFEWKSAYRRMAENGGQLRFPRDAVSNPEVIDEALSSERPIYLLSAGCWEYEDVVAFNEINNRYSFERVDLQFQPIHRMTEMAVNVGKTYSIFRLWPKGSTGTRFEVSPSGDLELQNDLGISIERVRVR